MMNEQVRCIKDEFTPPSALAIRLELDPNRALPLLIPCVS